MWRLVFTFAFLMAAFASAARAQPASGILNRDGPGVRLGASALTFHPGLSIEGGYDSNVYYLPSGPVGAGLLRLRAHFDLLTQPPVENGPGTVPPKIEFRLSTVVEYREYLSTDSRVQSQRSVIFAIAGDLVILPAGPFTLAISENFLRTMDPQNFEVFGGFGGQFVRDFNRSGIMASYRRGGLELGVGDNVSVSFWETTQLQFANTIYNDAQAYARLRFLPQTLGGLMVRVGYQHYPNRMGGNAVPFRAMVNASTLFTSWLGASAAIGYGGWYNISDGTKFHAVIAQAEVRFMLPYAARISLGYDRDFHPSGYANFFLDDRLFAAYDQPVIKKLTARLEGGVRFRHYEGLIDLANPNNPLSGTRDDLVYDLQVSFAYRPLPWLQLGLNYTLYGNDTNFSYMGPMGSVPVRFIKHIVLAQINFAY